MTTDNFQSAYLSNEPTRQEIDAMGGKVLLEFGAPWCPICKAAQPDIQNAVNLHPEFQHLKVEDGSGRPLGRSFRIKLWPTLIVLKDGKEAARVVRPDDLTAIENAIASAE